MVFFTNSVCLEIFFSCFNQLMHLFILYAIFSKSFKEITIYSCAREVYYVNVFVKSVVVWPELQALHFQPTGQCKSASPRRAVSRNFLCNP